MLTQYLAFKAYYIACCIPMSVRKIGLMYCVGCCYFKTGSELENGLEDHFMAKASVVPLFPGVNASVT